MLQQLCLDPTDKDLRAMYQKSAKYADQILFGTMYANSKESSVDAAAQVAPAMGVTPAVVVHDFFVTRDDLSPNGGAAQMDTSDRNSSIFYEYANLNVSDVYRFYLRAYAADEAKVNAGTVEADALSETMKITEAFLKSLLFTMPSGKQNPCASRYLPSKIFTQVHTRCPMNAANTFEQPLSMEQEDLSAAAMEKVREHIHNYERIYGLSHDKEITVNVDDAESPTLQSMVDEVIAHIRSLLTA